jgi:hypothetical protein
MKTIADCECGGKPAIFFISGSRLRLRVVGCPTCHTTSPARLTTEDAIEQWNDFNRNDKDGNRVSIK